MVHNYDTPVLLRDEVQHSLRPQSASMTDERSDRTTNVWRLRLSPFNLSIIHSPGRKHQLPDAVSQLCRDNEPVCTSNDEDIPNFEDAIVLVLRTCSATTEDMNPESDESNMEIRYVTDDDVDYPIDEEDISLDAIDIYQVVDLEVGIYQDHRYALEDDERDPPPEHDVKTRTASAPVGHVAIPVTISEIIPTQNIEDFCQTFFATMAQAKTFFFEGEDGVLRRRKPPITELEQIIVQEMRFPRLLHVAHHSKMEGHPGRTRMFANLLRMSYWPLMVANIASTVKYCPHCSQSHLRLICQKKPMPFPSRSSFSSLLK